MPHNVPIFLEEDRVKTIKAGSFYRLEGENISFNFAINDVV